MWRSNTAVRSCKYDRLPALAADFVRRQVAVIFAGSLPAIVAAKATTTTIPIVFTVGGDPVKDGLVASLNRPGGNATGVSLFFGELVAKRLELLREIVPGVTVIAVLAQPKQSKCRDPVRETCKRRLTPSGSKFMFLTSTAKVKSIRPSQLRSIGSWCTPRRRRSVPREKLERVHLITLAARHAVPAIYDTRDYPAAGGLMSYGANFVEAYSSSRHLYRSNSQGRQARRAPVIQPTKFELVINLKTAKALGLDVPASLLAAPTR